ncbi:MAG TPA: hypothetical protein DCE78_13280 [Bacteroidetes bacterium]|nr:hypothetical protein [Bacteroidota bacterium]
MALNRAFTRQILWGSISDFKVLQYCNAFFQARIADLQVLNKREFSYHFFLKKILKIKMPLIAK